MDLKQRNAAARMNAVLRRPPWRSKIIPPRRHPLPAPIVRRSYAYFDLASGLFRPYGRFFVSANDRGHVDWRDARTGEVVASSHAPFGVFDRDAHVVRDKLLVSSMSGPIGRLRLVEIPPRVLSGVLRN
jgi:hypothetical protein